MKRLIVLIVTVLATVIGSSRPAVAGVTIQGTYSDFNFPGQGYFNIDTPLFPSNDPTAGPGQVNPAYFYSSQFSFTGGPGGYIGIQKDVNGKRAIFSIWGANAACCSTEPGAICRPFGGEGEGYQTMIPFNWVAGHSYRTRVWTVSKDNAGEWWLGALIDDTARFEKIIGTIRVPHGRGWLGSWMVTWTEFYGPQAASCKELPLSVVFFGRPSANAGAVRAGAPVLHLGAGACSSSVTNWDSYWVRHRNGWGN